MIKKETMSQMYPGQRAVVCKMEAAGAMRRRLLDIGLIENTEIECVGKSPMGDPLAFQIRGAVMAIRKKEAEKVRIQGGKKRYKIALAGNPNVGKSTVFNGLTGMKQHTGNWSGKTVISARGVISFQGEEYELVDIPGCYSLMAHSAEEEVARDFLCFEEPDAAVIVCDVTCLERNLNLALQIMEVVPRVVICINMMDEAKKKKINVDLEKLSGLLHTRVVGTTARSRRGLDEVLKNVQEILAEGEGKTFEIPYEDAVEVKIKQMLEEAEVYIPECRRKRWICARFLDGDESLCQSIRAWVAGDKIIELFKKAEKVKEELTEQWGDRWKDEMACATVRKAEEICAQTVNQKKESCRNDRRLDKIFTGRWTGFPIMILLLLGIFWLTITGANYPSEFLSTRLFGLEAILWKSLLQIGLPVGFCDFLISGIYRVVVWVISVMLPPMAIFFPLFTLMEDFGYLPRAAFNLDKCFQKCNACGKQALTMMMGVGCNAVGVTGCRIIDSPRERLIAILTNSLVPCNGRFPTLIALISMFLLGSAAGIFSGVFSAILLTLLMVFSILMTFGASALLSKTLLRGMPSAFILELPPYRRPQVGKVIVQSICDRTLFVLGRAVSAAIPAGALLWIMANLSWNGMTLLSQFSGMLDPFAKMLGMDGVILMAFILGFPANEIVVPIIIMAYMAEGKLIEIPDLKVLKELLIVHGWTWKTAISTMLFSMMHWPCATTCLTIKKETGSLKWTVAAILLPTLLGMGVCFIINLI